MVEHLHGVLIVPSVRHLEALSHSQVGGTGIRLGIMADDVAAGAYALIVNSVLISAYLLLFPSPG